MLIKLRTTLNAERGGPNQRGRTGYRRDEFGFNSSVGHFLAKLREPEFRQKVALSRESVDQLKHYWRQREREEADCREKLIRQQRPSDEARSHYSGGQGGHRGGRRAQPREHRQDSTAPPPQQSAPVEDFEELVHGFPPGPTGGPLESVLAPVKADPASAPE